MKGQASLRVLGAWLALHLLAAPAPAQVPDQAQLKKQFEQRYRSLVDLKDAGKVGETWEGFLAAVEPRFEEEPGLKRLLNEENRDRKFLYELLAEELRADLKEPERSAMTPLVVAERNAWRNFEKASDTHKLRVAEKTWVTKKDRPRLLRLLELQDKGLIGETNGGYVAVVRPESARDSEVQSIVDRENTARRQYFEKLAREQGVSVETVASEHAKRYHKSAHLAVFLQVQSAKWKPKTPERD